MNINPINLKERNLRGKGPARRLRAAGEVPGIIYGLGQAPKSVSLSPKELNKALETNFGKNIVLSFSEGNGTTLAMFKEVSRHPVSQNFLHVDLYRVTGDQVITVNVPFQTQGRALGVQKGGKMRVIYRQLPLKTSPLKIPEAIIVNVTPLDSDTQYTVADLQVPEGVTVLLPPTQTLVAIDAERAKDGDDGEQAGE